MLNFFGSLFPKALFQYLLSKILRTAFSSKFVLFNDPPLCFRRPTSKGRSVVTIAESFRRRNYKRSLARESSSRGVWAPSFYGFTLIGGSGLPRYTSSLLKILGSSINADAEVTDTVGGSRWDWISCPWARRSVSNLASIFFSSPPHPLPISARARYSRSASRHFSRWLSLYIHPTAFPSPAPFPFQQTPIV